MKKKGLELNSIRPSTLLMAEVGWERRYARSWFDQADTWSSLLTSQIVSCREKKKTMTMAMSKTAK